MSKTRKKGLILVFFALSFLAVTDGRRCPAGTGVSSSKSCTPCVPGTYNDGSMTSVLCTRCPDGYTSSETGATDASGCTKCAVGYIRDSNSGDCVACPRGTYSATIDAASCTSCPEGQTTLHEGSGDVSLCHACQPGTRFVVNLRMCVACSEGSYSDGQTGMCTYCPTGYTNRGRGKTSVEDCTVCNYGYGREGDRCVACPIGSYGNIQTQRCHPCPAGTTTTRVARSYCSCLSGHYRLSSFGECQPCPKGTYRGFFTSQCLPCPAGTTTTAEGQSSASACVTE